MSKLLIQELLEYFYYKQYEHDYYPCYDMHTEMDVCGNQDKSIIIVDMLN